MPINSSQTPRPAGPPPLVLQNSTPAKPHGRSSGQSATPSGDGVTLTAKVSDMLSAAAKNFADVAEHSIPELAEDAEGGKEAADGLASKTKPIAVAMNNVKPLAGALDKVALPISIGAAGYEVYQGAKADHGQFGPNAREAAFASAGEFVGSTAAGAAFAVPCAAAGVATGPLAPITAGACEAAAVFTGGAYGRFAGSALYHASNPSER